MQGRLQHLVTACPQAHEGRVYLNVRLDAEPLQLPAIGVEDLVTAEHDADAAGQRDAGDVAVGAVGRAADKPPYQKLTTSPIYLT